MLRPRRCLRFSKLVRGSRRRSSKNPWRGTSSAKGVKRATLCLCGRSAIVSRFPRSWPRLRRRLLMALRHFPRVALGGEPCQLLHLLQQDMLGVHSEDVVFYAVARWADATKPATADLLTLLRGPLGWVLPELPLPHALAASCRAAQRCEDVETLSRQDQLACAMSACMSVRKDRAVCANEPKEPWIAHAARVGRPRRPRERTARLRRIRWESRSTGTKLTCSTYSSRGGGVRCGQVKMSSQGVWRRRIYELFEVRHMRGSME
jgi:hypothetical protein